MFKNEIVLPGVNNARELGGYKIGDKTIVKGKLIRTGSLNNATEEAKSLIKDNYKVNTIIDFRMNDERKHVPDPEIQGVKYIGLSVVEMEDYFSKVKDIREVDKQLMWKTADKTAIFEQAYEYGMLGPETYIGFVLDERGKKAYKEFFKILLELKDDDCAILWHCTDGKDRTGLAAMLLLYALGADKKTIIYDYMLTNEYNAQTLDFVKSKALAANMPQRKMDALLFCSGGVIERYMTNAIETLENNYGSVKEYLFEELGVGDMERKTLKARYLE